AGERGSNEDVEAWLFKAESMFAMCGVTDENICIEYAGQALIGNASTWHYSRRKSQALNRIETWEEWKRELKIQFQSTNTYDRAKTELFRIQQGKSQSVQGNTEKFLSLSNIVSDVAEKDLMHIFREGLQPALKIEVIKQQPHTLAATLELVERLENVTIQSGFRPMFGSGNTANSVPTPMDLGAMQNTPRPYRAPPSKSYGKPYYRPASSSSKPNGGGSFNPNITTEETKLRIFAFTVEDQTIPGLNVV
ncbi:hypothetical protein CEUSTIGMA_g13794.t1, partial [Chlamydomonas eustigma]